MSDIAVEIPQWMREFEGCVVFDGVGVGTLEISVQELRPYLVVSYLSGGRRLLAVRNDVQWPVRPMNVEEIEQSGIMYLGSVPRKQALHRRILEGEKS